MSLYLLFESASGYALFERIESEEIGQELPEVQKSTQDLSKFGRIVKLKSFIPFKSAAHALENINDITEGIVSDHLKEFLQLNLPSVKPGKKPKFQLGVAEPKLGGAITEAIGVPCTANDLTEELLRGIRLHFDKFIKQFKPGDLEKAQLGLGHSYSRAKLKFNVNRSDNMIIQAIALVDQLDKDLNTFSMRVREWYGWHFPELIKIVNDNYTYARLAKFIKNKSLLTEEHLPELEEICMDATKAKQILDAARSSMGTDISDIDMINIENFASKVISLAEYRKKLHGYLSDKMHIVAPNLSSLVGETVGARLIAHAGSLTNLAKYPASTVQILGAEKALFRALKTKGNTPKYGLIFHSTFIGRAAAKNKGRISRYLANKCTIASRIDCFSENATTKFGDALKDQVEERLEFFETGKPPAKNLEVMKKVLADIEAPKKTSTPGKRKSKEAISTDVMDETPVETPKKKKKKAKKQEDMMEE